MFERSNFLASLAGIGVIPVVDIFDELVSAYTKPSRHYHTQTHVAECLASLARFRALAEKPAEIEVAIWFHDAIYDTRRGDNEEMSAQWAERYLVSEKADRRVISRIADMILATKSHDAQGTDAELLIDIDLGIFGASPAAFEAYDQAIRREYVWMPEGLYRAARREVLKSFLQRESIYNTLEFKRRYEAQARENLTHKITQLGA